MPQHRITDGPKNPNTKLDWAMVRDIRSLYRSGWTQRKLAMEYQVSINTIGRIVTGTSWQEPGMVLGKAMTEPELQDAAAASLRKLQGMLAEPEKQERKFTIGKFGEKVYEGAAESTSPIANNPPMSLEELLRRESERPDPAGERALERLNETAKQADGGLGELLGPVIPE